MGKRLVLGSLVLVGMVGLVIGFYNLSCFAQEGETITITTYYPSPYGVYNHLQAKRMAVGDTDVSGGIDAADLPEADGQLYTARSVIYKPQSSLPEFDAREGELVYIEADKKFYYYDGSKWTKQAGGGTAVMYLSCAWGTDWRAGPRHGWDGSCTPPECPEGWDSVATFSEPVSVACSSDIGCYWESADTGTHPVVVGRSVRVCVKD